MNDAAYERLIRHVQEIAAKGLARTAIETGAIDPTGLSELEFVQKLHDWIEQLSSDEIAIVLDHRSSLLRRARAFRSKRVLEVACLLYATWTEHWINGVLHCLTVRSGLERCEFRQIVRDVPLRGKLTWLLRVLDAPRIRNAHLQRIDRLIEARNSFVHYKWDGAKEDESPLEILTNRAVSEFEPTVKYLQRYERSVVHKGAGKTIRSLTRKSSSVAA